MSPKLNEVIDQQTDVLIIGGGGGGLRAAISARQNGAEVLLVSKSRAGFGNNTAIARGGFAAAGGWRETRDNATVHADDTLRSGRFINNPRLVQVLAEGSVQQVYDLESFGVNLSRMEGTYRLGHVPGHTYPRNVSCVEHIGTGISVPMRRHAMSLGVKLLEGIAITRLLKKGGVVIGVVGIDGDGRVHSLQAKSTILATGGLGQIYQRTNNAAEATGDGYALAYEVGLPLQDMEFVQFYPTCLRRPGVMSLAAYEIMVVLAGTTIRNSLGQNILELHGLTNPLAITRDKLAQAIMQEVKAGRSYDGYVNFDLTTVPESKRDRYRDSLPKGSTYEQADLKVSPAVHYCMGGIRINERAETSLDGLYAAGEVCGGIQGANRLAGNALTDIFVFGAIAGKEAAERASKTMVPDANKQLVKEEVDRLESWLNKTGKEKVSDLIASLKKTMWDNVGAIRDEVGLKQAIAEIGELRLALDLVGVSSPKEWLQALRLDKMLTVSEMVAKSALMRKESRGAHYRSDYPEEKDPEWRCNVVVQREGKKMAISRNPVSSTTGGVKGATL